jgi:hypothetical protein
MRLLSGFTGCTSFLALGSATSLRLRSLSFRLSSLALLSGCSLTLLSGCGLALLLLSCVARCLVRVGGCRSAGSLLTLLSSLESRRRALLSLSGLLLSTLSGLLSLTSLLLSLTSLLLAIGTSLCGSNRLCRSTWLVTGQSRAIAYKQT